VMGLGRQGNPHLLAVEDVIFTVPPCGRGHRRYVGADARFGEAEAGDLLAACLGDEKSLALRLRPPLKEGLTVQPHMDRHDDS
jgi:hypothetical protein